jgi:lipopolysaccharide biosynthesis regulator YciM
MVGNLEENIGWKSVAKKRKILGGKVWRKNEKYWVEKCGEKTENFFWKTHIDR